MAPNPTFLSCKRRLLTPTVALCILLIASPGLALENEDLLALVAMPLAVAAVADLPQVPEQELIDVVTLLNEAEVSAAQFMEVIRYVPAALAESEVEPRFADYLRTRSREGLQGTALVGAIEERFTKYDLPAGKLTVTKPRTIDVIDGEFFPPVVRDRLVRRAAHPHGGPPGQLKKERGLQTGAEVVHGTDTRKSAAGKGSSRNKGKAEGKGKGKAKGREKG